ncbi:hypothetical protein EV126DRAFT_397191 [Verticillium dahliae]|nr:hypothetical protein EV126DRAFT_397191 [Verticillium dahliae]
MAVPLGAPGNVPHGSYRAESRHHPEVPASRLKKRELDRKAQRAARKRTQDRIVQLEELVAHLSRNDINAEASRLMERLLQTTQERDKLMGVLSSLGATIRHHTDTFSAQSKVSLSSVVGAMVSPSDLPEDVQPSDQTHTLEEGPASPLSRNEYVTPGTCFPPPPANASCEFDTPEKPIIAGKPMMTSYSRHVVQNLDEVKQTPITLLRSDSELSQETNSFGNSFIIPQSPQPCHCSTVLRVNQRNPNPNIWRLANHALGRPVKMSPLAIEDEDRASQDTPVRAIVEGWESVERAGMMTDSWRKLRIIDGLCLSKCGPGVRERFVFSQHHYCANIFWHLFGSSLTILWQFGFNNCFMKDTVTGRFQLSPFFEDRIRDINSWTMNVDFFDHFPELCDDIPIYGGIPPKLGAPDVSWTMPLRHEVCGDGGGHTIELDADANSSLLIVPSSAMGDAGTVLMSQNLKHIAVPGSQGLAYTQPSNIVPLNMMPRSPVSNEATPSGQHNNFGGPWLYSYCEAGSASMAIPEASNSHAAVGITDHRPLGDDCMGRLQDEEHHSGRRTTCVEDVSAYLGQ